MKRYSRDPKTASRIFELIVEKSDKSDLMKLNSYNQYFMTPFQIAVVSNMSDAVFKTLKYNRNQFKEKQFEINLNMDFSFEQIPTLF